jgi:DNA-binding transcriptional regulator YiaG
LDSAVISVFLALLQGKWRDDSRLDFQTISPMDSGDHNHRYSARIALGTRLKRWRLSEHRKISDVAASLGVSTPTWGHWETGEHLPSGDLLIAIEDLTGIPLHVLFCPHLETCPQLKMGQDPMIYDCCCQCVRAQARHQAGS